MSITETHIFSQSEFDRFAELSGDNNPIHVDPSFAARSRFSRTVAHGMLLYSRLSGVLGRAFPGWAQQDIEMIFPAPTFTGVETVFRLAGEKDRPQTGTFQVEVRVGPEGGDPGLQGGVRLRKAESVHSNPDPAAGEQPPSTGDFKGLTMGRRAERIRTFQESDLAAYAELSGDTGPVAAGVIPGGLLGGMISDLLGTELPGRGTNWLKQSFEFLDTARPGETITAAVEVTRLRPEKNLVDLRSTCFGPAGRICTGRSLVWVGDLIT